VNVIHKTWHLPSEDIVALLLREYSFLIVCIGLSIAAGLMLLTNKPKLRDYLAFGVIVVGLISAWGILHPRQTPLMDDAKMVRAMIGSGTPVLLEFQSPFWITCTQVKPVVDALEEELNNRIGIGKQIHFIRLNIQETVGMELAPVYKFEYTPTFIFFDAQGNEVWRTVGIFDAQKVRDSLKWVFFAAFFLTFGTSATRPGIAASPHPNYLNLSNPTLQGAPLT
jgi:thiol-disulfide isomerase/thioredoxin